MTTYLERLRAKPEAVRRQIAFGSAFGISGLIAIVWLSTSLATGAFAISDSSFATAGEAPTVVAGGTGFSDLLGAAGAAITGTQDEPAHIEIVDTEKSSTLEQKPSVSNQTVIPF